MRRFFPFVVLIFTGCANLSLNDVYQNPTFTYQSTKINHVSFSELTGSSVVQIRNSNPYNLPVSSLDAQLWLEGSPWLALDNDAISGLPSSNAVNVKFNWDLVFSELIQRANSVYQKGEAEFTLKLAPTLNVPVLGPQTVSWTTKFTVPVPKLPTIKVVDWSVSSISFSSLAVAFDLELDNPNVFAIDTSGWALDINKEGRSMANLKLLDSSLVANGKSNQKVEMSLSLVDAGLAVLNSLKSGKWPESFALNWSGKWQSPDLGFDLPDLAGRMGAPI